MAYSLPEVVEGNPPGLNAGGAQRVHLQVKPMKVRERSRKVAMQPRINKQDRSE
jgi:hypothetical protein